MNNKITDKKIIFLNPHVGDFTYFPLSFWFIRRRALKKYEYLDEVFLDNLYFLDSKSSTSLPNYIYKSIFSFFLKPFRFIERKYWNKINNRKLKSLKKNLLDDVRIFMFGYKISKDVLDFLKKNNFKNTIYIHLSHYHTFSIKKEYFDSLDIQLCFDNDVSSNNYFKKKFPFYHKKIIILPFQIKKRFFVKNFGNKETRISRIAATGTYHKFPPNTIEIKYKEFSTLHPIRLAVVLRNFKLKYFINIMSEYKSRSLLSLLGGQRKYMNLDIVDLYQNSSHSFVGAEGTGAIAIGTLESMAAGCIPMISKEESKGLLFNIKDADLDFYSDENELFNKILNFEENEKFFGSENNVSAAKNYLKDNLINNAKKVLDI